MDRILKTAAMAAPFAMGAVLLVASPAVAADAGQGAKVFASQCAMCHARTAGAHSGIGPDLFGIEGRKAGSYPGYSYSPAMKSAGFAWTGAQIDKYLANPQQVVHGNKMPYAGVHDAAQRADVVAYLETLK